MRKAKNTYYLDNQTFYQRLKEWQRSDEITIPNDIAQALIQICTNLSKSGRFAGYTWREDMVAEAILVCLKSARKFNPEKSTNPFSYFTQVAYNSFRKYLNTEHLRLATIEAYKRGLDTSYDYDVEKDEDNYNFIMENARSCDRVFHKYEDILKKKHTKKPTAVDIESCFED